MASTQFFISAILAVLVPSILATDFVVGDDKGWTTGFDYQTWADGKEFHVGDQLGKLALKPLSSLCSGAEPHSGLGGPWPLQKKKNSHETRMKK